MKKAIVFLSAIMAMFVSCSTSSSLSGEWTVLTINGEEVSAAMNAPAITIDGTRYSGVTGVNTINGMITLKGDNIKFEEGAMTRMAADPESMDIEMKYLDAINSAAKVSVNDSAMTLTDKDGAEVMTLKKK